MLKWVLNLRKQQKEKALHHNQDWPQAEISKYHLKKNISYYFQIKYFEYNKRTGIKFIWKTPNNKIEIIIAGAGGAAHLAGVTASLTSLPVLGVPIESKLKGLDSLLSTVQMPSGIPVGTLAIGKAGAINAALLAVSILSVRYKEIQNKLRKYRSNFEKKVPKRPF